MKKLMIIAGMLAALLVAAAPALGQQETPNQPEEVTVTGVIQAKDLNGPAFEEARFTITDEDTGAKRPIIGDIVEGGVDLSPFMGERATITGIPQTQGNPLSSFPNPNEVPLFVTSIESVGEGGQQVQYDEGAQEDQYADEGAQDDQYGDETGDCQPADDSGGGDSSGNVDVLPDTGGLAPLLAVGALLLLGSGIAGLSVARRRAL